MAALICETCKHKGKKCYCAPNSTCSDYEEVNTKHTVFDKFKSMDIDEMAEWFKDKSELVHLPCKVGDIVYCFEPCFDIDHRPRLKVVEKEIIELKTIATVFGLNFNIDSIGETVFLTREETEMENKK